MYVFGGGHYARGSTGTCVAIENSRTCEYASDLWVLALKDIPPSGGGGGDPPPNCPTCPPPPLEDYAIKYVGGSQQVIEVVFTWSAALSIGLYDIAGRRVRGIFDGPLSAGRHEIRWSSSGLGSGVYFVRFLYEGKRVVARTILLR